MSNSPMQRFVPEGSVPLLEVVGTAAACGEMLGHAWRESLVLEAQTKPAESKPWWMLKAYQSLIDRYAPHLPELYQHMARGAGVEEQSVGTRAAENDLDGCTSFALSPAVTLDASPISGQTKDTAASRAMQYHVLRLSIAGGPSSLSATYGGWLFGHGFVSGGCAIFRNALYAGHPGEGFPYGVWGVLALHCPSAQEAAELAQRHGVREGVHVVIADSAGGIVGIEGTKAGIEVLEPEDGIYVHANAVIAQGDSQRYENKDNMHHRSSAHRLARLRALLLRDRSHLTAQLAYAAMSDHDHFPMSICRHNLRDHPMTTATIVAEPVKGLLHVTRGPACQNWPHTYSIGQAT